MLFCSAQLVRDILYSEYDDKNTLNEKVNYRNRLCLWDVTSALAELLYWTSTCMICQGGMLSFSCTILSVSNAFSKQAVVGIYSLVYKYFYTHFVTYYSCDRKTLYFFSPAAHKFLFNRESLFLNWFLLSYYIMVPSVPKIRFWQIFWDTCDGSKMDKPNLLFVYIKTSLKSHLNMLNGHKFMEK